MPRVATRSRARARARKPLTKIERALAPVQLEKSRRKHDRVTSQRERIQEAFLACQHRLPDGRVVFLPEPQQITEEHADLCRALALELLDLARREKGRWRTRDEREGKKLNRAEILNEDCEEGLAHMERALERYRNCPAHEVGKWLNALITGAEAVQIAVADEQGLLELAGYPRGSSMRTRDVLAARTGDVKEIDHLKALASRNASRAEQAETELAGVRELMARATKGDKRASALLADWVRKPR